MQIGSKVLCYRYTCNNCTLRKMLMGILPKIGGEYTIYYILERDGKTLIALEEITLDDELGVLHHIEDFREIAPPPVNTDEALDQVKKIIREPITEPEFV